MKLPITVTQEHQGKALDIDCDHETLTLLNDKGQALVLNNPALATSGPLSRASRSPATTLRTGPRTS